MAGEKVVHDDLPLAIAELGDAGFSVSFLKVRCRVCEGGEGVEGHDDEWSSIHIEWDMGVDDRQ